MNLLIIALPGQDLRITGELPRKDSKKATSKGEKSEDHSSSGLDGWIFITYPMGAGAIGKGGPGRERIIEETPKKRLCRRWFVKAIVA